MTIRAIAGLLVLHALIGCAGLAALYALRGFRTWTDVLRLAGVGYLLGLAALGIAWTQLLVVGVPFGPVVILATLVALFAGALLVGRRRGMERPRGWSLRSGSLGLIVGAVGIALAGLYAEALFAAGRLQSLQAFDAWAFWTPKAEAIYHFGGLDEQVFTTAAGPSYPPLLPAIDAASFHAIGRADVVTLHLQFWVIAIALVAALAGLLAVRVPAWLLWPLLLLVVVVPRISGRLLIPQADVLVDAFFAVAALLVALWVRDGRGWRLVAAGVLLGGASLTKREGLLFAAVVVVAGLALAGWRAGTWKRLAMLATFVVAVGIPWRIWFSTRDLPSDAPSGIPDGAVDRALDAVRLSLRVFLDDGRWSVVPILFAIAIAAAAIFGDRRLALYSGVLLGLVLLGGAWITFAFAEIPVTDDEAVNPIVRYTAAAIFLAGALTPLLLASVWRGRTEPSR